MIARFVILFSVCAVVYGNGIPEFQVDQQVKDILMHLRQGETGLPGEAIPDSMPVPDFETNINQAMTKLNVNLSNITIEGLSLFVIDHVKSNLAAMDIHIGLNFSQLTIRGHYLLDGSVSFFKAKGDGEFWMNISNAYVSGIAHLGLVETAQLQLEHIHLDIIVKDIKVHFENLLGSGYLAKITNSALNALSSVIFDAVKPSIVDDLSEMIKELGNEQLLQMPALPFFVNAVSPLDDAIEAATSSFAAQGFEPMPLPSWERSFSRQVLWVTVSGQLKMDNGHIKGLSTLYRTGNITATFHNNTFILAADLGFDELQGGYIWYANLVGLGKEGAVHIRATDIEFHIVASQKNEEGSSPIIESLTVNEIEQISTDVDGLGAGNFAMEWIVGVTSNVFKYQLTQVIQGPVKQSIQDNLSDIKMPF